MKRGTWGCDKWKLGDTRAILRGQGGAERGSEGSKQAEEDGAE